MKRIQTLIKQTKTPQQVSTNHITMDILGTMIPLEVRRSSKARHLSISYRAGHIIRITAPHVIGDTTIQHFIKGHEQRILDHYEQKSDSIIESNPDLVDHSREHFLIHKESALQFCTDKVKRWNQNLGRHYNNIAVKSLKTKRGSCSSKGNLNFNYKIMFLPEQMADYIIVHELCHLREMNHSPRFWKLVEEVYGPEWKEWRRIR